MHRIPVEKGASFNGNSLYCIEFPYRALSFEGNSMCYIEIQMKDNCSASNSHIGSFNWTSMLCMEIQMKDNCFQRHSDALHQTPFENNCLLSGFQCTASNFTLRSKKLFMESVEISSSTSLI